MAVLRSPRRKGFNTGPAISRSGQKPLHTINLYFGSAVAFHVVMSRSILLFSLAGLFALLTLGISEPDADARLEQEAARLQERVDERAALIGRTTEYLAHELATIGATTWMQRHARSLEAEHEVSGAFYLGFVDDSLVCWSGSVPANVAAVVHDTARAQRVLPEAIHQHTSVVLGRVRLHGMAPVWITPSIENRYLHRTFHPWLRAPNGLTAQPRTASGPMIVDAAGVPLLRLAWRGDALDTGPWILVRLVLFLLGLGTFVAACWWTIPTLLQRSSPWVRSGAFAGAIFLIRWGTLSFVPSAPIDRLPLFDPATYAASAAFPSLGDLVINAALIVVVILFARRQLQHIPSQASPPAGAAPFIWALLFVGATGITNIIIGLVNDSSVDLDLYHVQSLTGTSAAALTGIALLFLAWVLTADTGVRILVRIRPVWVMFAFGLAVLTATILLNHGYGVRDTMLYLWPAPILLLLFHVQRHRPHFIHAIVGVGAFATLTAHVLTKYTRDREHRERLVLAERLSVKEDPVVEMLFREVAPSLRTDTALHRMITAGAPCSPGELDAAVRQIFYGGFWERYDVRVFAISTQGEVRCSSDGSSPVSWERSVSDFANPTALADMPDLYFEQDHPDGPFYHARLVVMPTERATPGQLVIELHHRSASQTMGFPDLLISGDEPLSRRADRYAIARYERGALADRSHARGIPLFWGRELGPERVLWYADHGMEYLARSSDSGTIMVLGLPIPGMLDKATTFSYLFALFSAVAAIAFIIHRLASTPRLGLFGIGAKVRTALFSFAIIGLILFGAGANTLLARQYAERSEASILEKARSAHTELQQHLDGHPRLTQRDHRYLEHLLANLSNVLYSDITVYDVKGGLIASSRPQVFTNGLLGPRMNPVAFVRMAVEQASDFVHQESIGTAHYRTAYMPLRDRKGAVLGYLALPSFADQRQQEQERSGVLVAVANLFVLFFALSVLVALFISNWTTRPLDVLKNALSRIGLQGTNEPIRYRGDDEVGQLVEVYNRKVEELRLSAEKLAHSERENAWKEMARQVAHEIKNPLTPMKLNIQHFQHTWRPDAPDAKERLDRFSNNLVEQIDVLSRIANEFSHFAQMPPAHPTHIDLADVAAVVAHLFSNTPGGIVQLNASEPLPVYADREHLLRTFNNLIKNALQAIPEGRIGRVEINMHREDKEAVVEVRDNGTGIPSEVADLVFLPKFSTKSSGMGLGLPMVKRMVENAGGRVWFNTQEGVGTSFFVALPLRT